MMAVLLASALPALFGTQAAVASGLPSGGPLLLRVCTTGDYKPLTYRDPVTGQYSGVDIDMATDLAVHLGREPLFVATTWAGLAQDVNTPGRCDIAMGGITVTAARQQIAEFTVPYLDSGKVPLVAQAGADAFGSIDQIDEVDELNVRRAK
jgi:cyclohexadienyl dehydratase